MTRSNFVSRCLLPLSICALGAAVVLGPPAPAQAQAPEQAQAVDQRGPTVVFESGLGDDSGVWRRTIAQLGNAMPVFSYDRPGYGHSPARAAPRDPCTIATELHAGLAAAGHAPPYILVGHSLGGQYAYAFARLFPQDMAGLVLVDATPIGHWRALRERMPVEAEALRAIKALAFSRTMRREFDGQDQCLAELGHAPLPFPARVLIRGRGEGPGGERLLRLDREMATSWLTMTGARQIETIRGSGHYIQRDKPNLLADVIRDIARMQWMRAMGIAP